MRAPLAVAMLLAAQPLAAEVAITPVGEHVSVRAVAAPLAEVLDQLARRTGMRVTYEGSQPRQPVTLTVEDRTTVQAVMAVMEGQGVNFGLRMDASGTRVDQLLVLGLAPVSTGSTQSNSAATHPAPMQVLPAIIEEEREEPPEIDQPDPEPQPPPGLVPPQGPPTRRPGGPMQRGPVQSGPPVSSPSPESSLTGGSPFAPRPPQLFQQPQTKEEQPN